MASNEVMTKMFGIDHDELVRWYGPGSPNMRVGRDMLLASMMSDAQELIERGLLEDARQLLNRAKWVIVHANDSDIYTKGEAR